MFLCLVLVGCGKEPSTTVNRQEVQNIEIENESDEEVLIDEIELAEEESTEIVYEEDFQSPTIAAITVENEKVLRGEDIIVDIEVNDDVSGFMNGCIYFRSQKENAVLISMEFDTNNFENGHCTIPIHISENNPVGEYLIELVNLCDRSGNATDYSGAASGVYPVGEQDFPYMQNIPEEYAYVSFCVE